MSIRFHRKAFRATILLAYPRGRSLSRIHPILWHTPLPLHASSLHHWLLWPSLDYTTSWNYPFQQNSSPFCWSCASTLRSLQQIFFFPGLRSDGAGRHQFSKVRRMLSYLPPLILVIIWASLHAASRAPCSCHSLLLRPILKFWSVGVTLMRITWANHSERRILVSNVRTHRIGFSMFKLFRKIDEDLGGSISWDTQPNCRVIFNMATALL